MCTPNTAYGKLSTTSDKQAYDTLRGIGIDPKTAETMTAVVNPGGQVTRDIGTTLKGGDNSLSGAEAKAKADGAAAEEAANKEQGDLLRNTPDLTDKAVQEARRRQARLLTMGQGRRSTFLSGPAGDTSAKPLGYRSLLGGG